MDILVGIITLIVMSHMAYIGVHMSEERRLGKQIPLWWEKKNDK